MQAWVASGCWLTPVRSGLPTGWFVVVVDWLESNGT